MLSQVVLIIIFAVQVVFRVTGRDYDAAMITGGFLGLGATPEAIAIPTPVEYTGTVIAASGKECHMKAPARVFPGIQSVGDFFRRQLGQRRGEMKDESAWRNIPSRGSEVPGASHAVPAASGEGR